MENLYDVVVIGGGPFGIASVVEAKKAGFMHHSPRYSESELKRLEKEGKEVYPNVFMCKDGMHFDIPLKS